MQTWGLRNMLLRIMKLRYILFVLITRWFFCGTNKGEDSNIVEWNDTEGTIKRAYIGLGKKSMGVVQFDIAKNWFLAVGDEYIVKFWDMDNVNLLATTDAEGGLHASPCIRFNKEGILLTVSTNDNGIKILANTDGIRLLQRVKSRSADSAKIALAAIIKDVDGRSSADESIDKSRTWKITEINEPSQWCFVAPRQHANNKVCGGRISFVKISLFLNFKPSS